MPTRFVGHVALPSAGAFSTLDGHKLLTPPLVEDFVRVAGAVEACFVFEYGTENAHPHLHYEFASAKSKPTLHRLLRQVFGKAEFWPEGVPGQFASCKAADEAKLPRYHLYIAKGVHGKHGDEVVVLYESAPRMWAELHESFHRAAVEVRAVRGGRSPRSWYLSLADDLKRAGKTSRQDVLEAVTRYYVYDSQKGFDKFAVTRTFWAVYSIVAAADSHAMLLEQCTRMVEQ